MSKKVKKTENLIYEEYLDDYEKYKKIYGEKTIVLMQVGGFYECYATDARGPNLKNFSKIIHVVCSKKNKSIPEISINNPYMLGFPLISSPKFINILIENGFTVIIKDQKGSGDAITREVSDIVTPGVYIDNIETDDSNYIACIVLEEHKQRNGSILLSAGMS